MATDIGTLEYQVNVLQEQIKHLEAALNEAREKAGLPPVQMPKPARGTRIHQG